MVALFNKLAEQIERDDGAQEAFVTAMEEYYAQAA